MTIAWKTILAHYDAHHRTRVDAERAWFAASGSLDDAIRKAALANDSRGKRFGHQRHIPQAALQTACDALLADSSNIGSARSFAELMSAVRTAVADVYRTGELYEYETALRIAYYRHLLPARVYVHAGTRTGARALGLNTSVIDIADLPRELHDRSAHEIEDILCIYKDHFGPNGDAADSLSNSCGPGAPKQNAARSC